MDLIKNHRQTWANGFNLLLIFILISGCTSKMKDKYQDEFYNKKGGFDYYRLPLIKPYALISTDQHPDYWSSALNNNEILYQISIAGQEIFVTNDFFVIACFQICVLKGVSHPEVYYLIIPEKKTGKAFNSLEDLVSYTSSEFGVKNITFSSIKDIFLEFEKTGILPWKDQE